MIDHSFPERLRQVKFIHPQSYTFKIGIFKTEHKDLGFRGLKHNLLEAHDCVGEGVRGWGRQSVWLLGSGAFQITNYHISE